MLTFLKRVLVGTLVGLGAVLPGISGGVLCVMFGLYKPIIEFLSHPKRSFKKYASMVLPVFLGVAVGFVVVARILEFFLTKYEAVSVYRPDCRRVPVAFKGSRKRRAKQVFVDILYCGSACRLCRADRCAYVQGRDRAERVVVRFLRRLHGREHYRAGHELFHAAYAARTL